jgi:hypothetical protein
MYFEIILNLLATIHLVSMINICLVVFISEIMRNTSESECWTSKMSIPCTHIMYLWCYGSNIGFHFSNTFFSNNQQYSVWPSQWHLFPQYAVAGNNSFPIEWNETSLLQFKTIMNPSDFILPKYYLVVLWMINWVVCGLVLVARMITTTIHGFCGLCINLEISRLNLSRNLFKYLYKQ